LEGVIVTELGNVLKEARESKGLSLDELQSITKIQKRYLLGIEQGDYSMMPGKFYVRAFIKQYAEAVGLEPDQLLEQYKNEIPSTYNEELPEQLSRVSSRKSLSPDTSRIFDILPKILIGVFIIGATALVWFLIVNSAGDEGKEQVMTEKGPTNFEESEQISDGSDGKKGKKEDEKAKDDEDPAKDEAEEAPKQELKVVDNSGSNSTYELKNAEKFSVKVVSTGETWVGVSNASGKTVFQGIMKKGTNESWSQDFSNETEVTINIGKTPETEIYVNDEKLEYAIPPEEDMTQKITIKFMK